MSEENETHLDLADVAVMCLVGYLSSGRNHASIDGNIVEIEKAAIIRAKNLLKLLKEEK